MPWNAGRVEGNVNRIKRDGLHDDRMRGCCGAERISVVAYYRERIAACGSLAEEAQRAEQIADKRNRFAGQG
jgi:hypothetical protein